MGNLTIDKNIIIASIDKTVSRLQSVYSNAVLFETYLAAGGQL